VPTLTGGRGVAQEEMNKLLRNMDAISSSCSTLESHLDANRSRVEKFVRSAPECR
jgi:hypothetical protein